MVRAAGRTGRTQRQGPAGHHANQIHAADEPGSLVRGERLGADAGVQALPVVGAAGGGRGLHRQLPILLLLSDHQQHDLRRFALWRQRLVSGNKNLKKEEIVCWAVHVVIRFAAEDSGYLRNDAGAKQ